MEATWVFIVLVVYYVIIIIIILFYFFQVPYENLLSCRYGIPADK